MNEGFLGTAAPRYADLVLLLEIAIGLGLLAGALLARMRRFRAHAWCQSVIVLLNFAVIVLVMVPSFRSHVSPRIPLKLGKAYYAVATAHAALGSAVECAGLYILLTAATDLLPEKLRITRYKPWMRTVLAAWWVVLFLGLATYARWLSTNTSSMETILRSIQIEPAQRPRRTTSSKSRLQVQK